MSEYLEAPVTVDKADPAGVWRDHDQWAIPVWSRSEGRSSLPHKALWPGPKGKKVETTMDATSTCCKPWLDLHVIASPIAGITWANKGWASQGAVRVQQCPSLKWLCHPLTPGHSCPKHQPQQIGTESRTETSMMFYRDFTGAVHTLVEQNLYINQREVINEDVLKSTWPEHEVSGME